MPYWASTLASISGDSLRSLSNGLPGAARIMKKATVIDQEERGDRHQQAPADESQHVREISLGIVAL